MGIGDALALAIDGDSAVEMLFPNLMIGMLAMAGVAGVNYFFRRVASPKIVTGLPDRSRYLSSTSPTTGQPGTGGDGPHCGAHPHDRGGLCLAL
jgi:hypothetical protein